MRRQTLVIPIALLLAVMAAAGVVLYTMNVKEEATTGGPTSTVVVASEDVPAGTELDPLIEEGKLVEQEIPKNYIVPGAVGSLEELQGRTVSQPLLKGEQILANRIDELGTVARRLLGIPDGFSAYTLELRPEQTVGNQLTAATTFGCSPPSPRGVAFGPRLLSARHHGAGRHEPRGDRRAGGLTNQLVTLAVTPEDAAKLGSSRRTPARCG